MLVLLTGGTGGAKLVQGFSLEVNPGNLVIICNTADDFVFHGLHISPDLDTITYTMAGLSDAAKGWGIKGDTFVVLEWLERLGGESWFKLGDRDLATHITRSHLLREGLTLSQITDRMRKRLGIESIILPMSDDRVGTMVETPNGEISFQDYFVRDRWRDEVHRITFTGVEKCRPAPGVLDSIREATAVILCPSNPITSIGPILAVPGIRNALRETRARIVAVSPITRGMPYSGPAHKFMAAMGIEVSAFGVANAYRDFLTLMLIALEDSELMRRIEGLGIQTVTTSIRMESLDDRRRVARELLALL